MQTYFLIERKGKMPRWCQMGTGPDGEKAWFDFKGRILPREEVGRTLAHVTGETQEATLKDVPEVIADLERSYAQQYLLDPWSIEGWLAPTGRFYGCKFFEHDDIAYALLRKSPGRLEKEGYVRVHAESFATGGFREITARQAETLEALGFSDTYPPGGKRQRPEHDRSKAPPVYAVKPPAGLESAKAVEPVLPSFKESLNSLLERLSKEPELKDIFDYDREIVTDTGGRWTWMVQFENFHVGGEDEPHRLLAAEGIHLSSPAFDQIELTAWPFSGLHIDENAKAVLDRVIPDNVRAWGAW